MVVVDPVGLTIGIGGLLAAFDGAVKGYLLIEEIFSKDNGVRDLALDYNIECEKLKSWGDRFNVKAGKEEDCLLYHERDSIKELMSNIFGRINSDLQIQPSGFNKQLQLESAEVEAISVAQNSKKQKKRVKWVIKNKSKFAEVVTKLRKANEDLIGLLDKPSFDMFTKTLPSYVLALMNNPEYLRQVRDAEGSGNDMIRQAAQLKLLQSWADDNHGPTKINHDALSPVQSSPGGIGSRHVSIYNDVDRVWVEWLEIESTSSSIETDRIRDRISTLSVMLRSPRQSFRVTECIGCLEDQMNTYRVGLVYRIPPVYGRATPVSLLHIIEEHRIVKKPALGDRFRLAQILATTMMQLHTSNWLHKAFRSDNILFLSGVKSSITDPYLAGFEYSRDTSMQSIGYRPSGGNALDYYYHPNVVNGFTKTLDLYSLGVVLLEIAFWKPLGPRIPKDKAKSLESIRELFIQTAEEKLDSEVGKLYADVVRACLKCTLPNPKYGAEFACAMNTEILLQLQQCKA